MVDLNKEIEGLEEAGGTGSRRLVGVDETKRNRM
ncbi:MAG: hypothetical protein RLZZ458_2406 [Planctomycetota bacterium]|jgi:hypothetical protein